MQKSKSPTTPKFQAETFSKDFKSQILTYVLVFVLPPLALKRINAKDAPFGYTQRFALNWVVLIYSIALVVEIVRRVV